MMDELNKKLALLEDNIQELMDNVQELENNIQKLKNDVQELRNMLEPITIIEGFVSLEKYIKLEILGSKTKAKKCQCVMSLFKNPDYKSACDKFLNKYDITVDHIDLIYYMKENGNITHTNPNIGRNEFENMAISYMDNDDDVDDNENDKKMVRELLKYLELKNPVDADGMWRIMKPY